MAAPIDMLPTCARSTARRRTWASAAIRLVSLMTSVAMVIPLTSCSLRPGKKAPLRALYYEDVPNWGLPTEENAGGGPGDTSDSESAVTNADASATSEPTAGLSSSSSSSSEAPAPGADQCPTEIDGSMLGQQCVAGIGGCARGGFITCAGSQLECTAVAGEPSDEVCNGIDDDCDGVVDDVTSTECSAGTGYCVRKGAWQCVGGMLSCDAEPGEGRPETCNGIDDDCDGWVDEDFDVGLLCRVNTGACFRAGVLECNDQGAEECSAGAGEPITYLCDERGDCDASVPIVPRCTDAGVGSDEASSG